MSQMAHECGKQGGKHGKLRAGTPHKHTTSNSRMDSDKETPVRKGEEEESGEIAYVYGEG